MVAEQRLLHNDLGLAFATSFLSPRVLASVAVHSILMATTMQRARGLGIRACWRESAERQGTESRPAFWFLILIWSTCKVPTAGVSKFSRTAFSFLEGPNSLDTTLVSSLPQSWWELTAVPAWW